MYITPRKILVLLGVILCISGVANGYQTLNDVMVYYSQEKDTLKRKAAEFLINNMRYHWSISNPLLDNYYESIARINKQYEYPECIEQYDMLYKQLGKPNALQPRKDIEVINAQMLIEHIESAFDCWKNGNWAQHLSFNEFCEYLLPYRIGNEKYEPWREKLRRKYLSSANTIMNSDDLREQPFWAACKVNDALKKLRFHNQKVLPGLQVEWPVSVLQDMRMGICYDYAKLTTYVMRACGIPVSLDFTPQWPDRAYAHHWNVLHDNTGFSVPFMGAESNPGKYDKQGRRTAKVYRCTFAYHPQSLFALNKDIGQLVPPALNTPFIKDVSAEYFKGYTLKVNLNNAHPRDSFAYIAVFNNSEWVPVDFARVSKNHTAEFHNLGGDIIYLPVYWGRNGCLPAGNMMLIGGDGSVKTMTPQMNCRQDIVLRRKYPLFDRIVQFRKMVEHGVFEAANSPDFYDAVTYAEIKTAPQSGYGTVSSSLKKGYRYWRYKAAANRKCYVAELRFYEKEGKLTPLQILTEGEALANTKPEYAFDGDELTYYESRLAKHGWVGADFGRPVTVDHIDYVPRNDDNDIVRGQHYELCYYNNGREVVVGTQEAKSDSLVFHDVPTGTVYILHNLDKGSEERIFTYEKRTIKWY